MTKSLTLQHAALRRARDLAGGVSYLAKHLHLTANDLDAMLHGREPIPTWVFLRVVDFVNEAESRTGPPPGLPADWEDRLRH